MPFQHAGAISPVTSAAAKEIYEPPIGTLQIDVDNSKFVPWLRATVVVGLANLGGIAYVIWLLLNTR